MLNKTDYSEIRRHPRLEKKLSGEYRMILPISEEVRVPITTETGSGGGLMFLSPRKIQEGAHLEFRLLVKNNPIEFTAKAVWSQNQIKSERAEPHYATGFQFTIITQEDISKLLSD
jgi:hypothetical protein